MNFLHRKRYGCGRCAAAVSFCYFAYVSSTSYFFPDSTRQKETVVPESAVPSKVKNTPPCMKF